MIECGSVVIVSTVCLKHEKCVSVWTLVYKMQVRLGESLWLLVYMYKYETDTLMSLKLG